MEQKQKICCCCGFCSAGLWTRVIAVLQILSFFFAGVKGSFFLVHQYRTTNLTFAMMMTTPTRQTLTVAQAKENLDFGDVAYPPYVYIVRLILILFLVLLPGIVLAVLLIYGSVKRQPIYMTAWTVHAISCLILYTLMAAVMGTFLKGAFRLAVFTFALWVVQVHKRELEMELEDEKTLAKRPPAPSTPAQPLPGRRIPRLTPSQLAGGIAGQGQAAAVPPTPPMRSPIPSAAIPRSQMSTGRLLNNALNEGNSYNSGHLGMQRSRAPPLHSPPYWKYGEYPQYNGGFANVV